MLPEMKSLRANRQGQFTFPRAQTTGLWWLRLPLQPTTSHSGALLTFAHCPDFKLRVSERQRTMGTGLFPTTLAWFESEQF
jgi:hypothetical protein